MGKKAIISKHIVLTVNTQSNVPLFGIILIEDEQISEIVLLENGVLISEVLEKYKEWSPEDYSDYYISPGIIDINTRVEWETYTELTKAAISGGVTIILAESGYYNESVPTGEMFSDIGKVATIEISTIDSIQYLAQQGYLAVKGYLFPPHNSIQCIPANLLPVVREVEKTHLTLIIDPNIPDPRQLHSVSPFRFNDLEDRLKANQGESQSFSGAFPDLIEDNDDEIEEHEDLPSRKAQVRRSIACEITKTLSNPDIDTLQVEGKKGNRNTTELVLDFSDNPEIDPEFANAFKRSIQKKKSKTIFDDLNSRIKQSQISIRTLSLAELETYKSAGITEYSSMATQKPGAYKEPVRVEAKPPQISSLMQRRNLSAALPSLVKPPAPSKENVYNFHMANYSQTWEISGINKIIEVLPKTRCRVHVCNISSASAINKIRQAKESFQNLTCEIPASHLIFSSVLIPENDTRFKNTPPIRNQANTNLLWDLLKLRGIDAVTSNHACINPVYKNTKNNFLKAANGMPTIGFSLQAVWTTLNGPVSTHSQLEIYIVRLAKWLSLYPAQILNISNTRGSISKGKYADLIVWKPFEKYVIDKEYSPFPEMSPFLGMELCGKIEKVFLRGNLAFNQGKFKQKGRFVMRLNH